MQTIHEYYEALAATYDRDRFGNSYGQYIDRLERRLLSEWLRHRPPDTVVELGCGTGRLMDFAHTGVDGSASMIAVAQQKRPGDHLVLADVQSTGLATETFDAAICFHVLMHLDEMTIRSVMSESARLVRRGGVFIFDIPSSYRRIAGRRGPDGWHAATSGTLTDVRRWVGPGWRLSRWRGLMAFPIHRVPTRLRAPLVPLDALIGRTPGARWSSYLAVELERS